jgi:hypothetical protein
MVIYYEKANTTVRSSKLSDADYLAPRLRESDRKEIWASNHVTPHKGLYEGIKNSVLCLTVEYKKEVVAMFGIHAEDLTGNKAIIWLLASDKLECMKITFIRLSRRFVDMMLSFYPFLFNYVHTKNTKSIAWLKVINAKIDEAKPYGLDQENFHYFSFSRG